MNDNITFGLWLKRSRQVLRLTQHDLAQQIGCSTVTIRKIEADERRPSTQVAELLANVLAIPAAERPPFTRFARAMPGASAFKPPDARETAPWRRPQALATNLPSPLTPLVGRERELRLLQQHLLQSDVRLLSLLGPPGVGKTRLAVALGHSVLDRFADGAFYAPLASVHEPELVVAAIARAIEVQKARQSVEPSLERLKQTLRDKHMFLLIDNFEQVLSAGPLVTDLLEACPSLKVLVTSRESLHLRGEKQFPLSALAFPAAERPAAALESALECYPAVKLFVERAAAVKPDFKLTNENAPAVAAICACLDGLPLAIELAAARVRLMPPEELLTRLLSAQGGPQLRLVSGGPSDLPVRQQTLQNAIDWSYHLLSSTEQLLFRRLAVFVGGFTLEAAEAIYMEDVGARQALPLHPPNIIDLLARLVDKSLLGLEQQGAQSRYVMLETIRQYAFEKLRETDEHEQVAMRHLAFFARLAEEAELKLRSVEQLAWLKRLDAELDNLRAGLDWSQAGGASVQRVENGLRLASGLIWFWYGHGHLNEGRQWLERLLSNECVQTAVYGTIKAKALYVTGFLAWAQGDHQRAESLLDAALAIGRDLQDKSIVASSLLVLGLVYNAEGLSERAAATLAESVRLYKALGSKSGTAHALRNLGTIHVHLAHYRLAAGLLEESLALSRELRDDWSIGGSIFELGRIARALGDYERARMLVEEALSLYRELDFQRNISHALNELGYIALDQNDLRRAAALYEESLNLSRKQGTQWTLADSLYGLGVVATRRGAYAEAQSLLDESAAVRRSMRSVRQLAQVQNRLADVARAQGDLAQAVESYRQSLHTLQDPKEGKLILADSLAGLAQAADAQDQPARAIQLFAAAAAIWEAAGVPLTPVERAETDHTLATLRQVLDEATFAKCWDAGRALTSEQAVAYALGE